MHNYMKKTSFLLLSLILCLSVYSLKADESKTVKPYPLDSCLVCGMKLGVMKPYTFTYQGQEIKVCSEAEKTAFEANPELFLKKLPDTKNPASRNK